MDCLRKELLYSEKRPRDLLFAAVEQLVAERPIMVSQLTREAAAAARAMSLRSDLEFQNWETASKAVVKAMLMADALLTPDGERIPFGITAQAAMAGALCENYRDVTEAMLLDFLIRSLGDVTTRDHMALAHALFRQFDSRISREDLEDRVLILLASLADRVVLIGDSYSARADEQADLSQAAASTLTL